MKEIKFTEQEVEQIFNYLGNSRHKWSEVNPIIQMILARVKEANQNDAKGK